MVTMHPMPRGHGLSVAPDGRPNRTHLKSPDLNGVPLGTPNPAGTCSVSYVDPDTKEPFQGKPVSPDVAATIQAANQKYAKEHPEKKFQSVVSCNFSS